MTTSTTHYDIIHENLDAHDSTWLEPEKPRGPVASEEDAEPASLVGRVTGWLRGITLAQLMRIVGSLVIVAAALAFMVQSWSGGDVLSRYFHFLGFSAVLCGAGFFCGLHNRDDKGARSFLALVTASVPAHFVVLSAIAFSQVAEALGVDRLHFAPPDPIQALMTVIVGLVGVAAMSWVAMKALARGEANRLSIAYLATNLLLMIPVRDANVVAVLAAVCGGALFTWDRRVLSPIPAMRTFEGRLLRIMMGAPIALLIGRVALYYSVSPMMAVIGWAAGAVALFGLSAGCRNRRLVAIPLEIGSLYMAVVSTCGLHGIVDRVLRIPNAYEAAMLTLGVGGVFYAASFAGALGAGWYRRIGALVASLGTLAALGYSANLVNSFLTLTASSAVMFLAFKQRERLPFALGGIGFTGGLLYQVSSAFSAVDFGSWGVLAVIGVAVMLGASYCEKNQRGLKARAQLLREQWSGWEA